jgi:hypothetical protein
LASDASKIAMIDVDCPNCGYHLGSLAVKPTQIESVKEATYPQDLDSKGLPGPVSVMQLSEDAFKTKGSVEASVAESRGEKRSQNPT